MSRLQSVSMVQISRIGIVAAFKLAPQTVVLIRMVLICLAAEHAVCSLVSLQTLVVSLCWQSGLLLRQYRVRIDLFVRATYLLKDTVSSHSSRRFGPALITLQNSRLFLARLIFASWLFGERSSHVSLYCRIQGLVKEGSH